MKRKRTGRLARAALAGIASLGLAVTACGEHPAVAPREPAAAGEPTLERAVCEARCARGIRCQGPRVAGCGCGGITGPALLRPDWANAEIACLGRARCEAEEDCETEAYRVIGAAPLSWPPVVMRCLQQADTCGGSSARCRRLAAMSDGARAEVAACLDRACDAFTSCFQTFFAARVAPAAPDWR